MEALRHLLIVFAGILLINVTLSAALWAQHRTPLHRALFALWVSGVMSAGLQGLVQSDRWIPLAFAVGSITMLSILADLVARSS